MSAELKKVHLTNYAQNYYNIVKNDKKTITDATQIKEVLSLSGNNWQTFIPNLENTDYNIDVYFNNSGKTTIHFKGCDLPDWITQRAPSCK